MNHPSGAFAFGSDGRKFDGDPHTPADVYYAQFRLLSALFGSDGGLSDSPVCISLRVHTGLVNHPSGAFASVAMDPSVMATHIPPPTLAVLKSRVPVVPVVAIKLGSITTEANAPDGRFTRGCVDPERYAHG